MGGHQPHPRGLHWWVGLHVCSRSLQGRALLPGVVACVHMPTRTRACRVRHIPHIPPLPFPSSRRLQSNHAFPPHPWLKL